LVIRETEPVTERLRVREIKKIPRRSQPSTACPFLLEPAQGGGVPGGRGGVDDISHEGLHMLLRGEGVTFQRLKSWKTSTDPHYAVKKARANVA
jgi:hypothetical protein